MSSRHRAKSARVSAMQLVSIILLVLLVASLLAALLSNLLR